MKKTILAIALIAGISSGLWASTNEKISTAEKNITATIKNQIIFPEFLREQDGEFEATIIFRVSDSGSVIVKEIQCDDEELRNNLMNQSEHIRLDTTGLDTKDTYRVVVRFKTL